MTYFYCNSKHFLHSHGFLNIFCYHLFSLKYPPIKNPIKFFVLKIKIIISYHTTSTISFAHFSFHPKKSVQIFHKKCHKSLILNSWSLLYGLHCVMQLVYEIYVRFRDTYAVFVNCFRSSPFHSIPYSIGQKKATSEKLRNNCPICTPSITAGSAFC